MAPLNNSQFGGQQPMSRPGMQARDGAGFHGQMRRFRHANAGHPMVQEYHRAQEEGFYAHVEGLVHHASSIDNAGEPLVDRDGYATEIYMKKRKDNANTARRYPNYHGALLDSLHSGTSDPIHVAMGHDMASDSKYGGTVGDRQNNVWLGNGNHRLVEAHDAGIKRIWAQKHKEGTGTDGEEYMTAPQLSDMHARAELVKKDFWQREADQGKSWYGPNGTYHGKRSPTEEGDMVGRGEASYGPNGSFHVHPVAPLRSDQFGYQGKHRVL